MKDSDKVFISGSSVIIDDLLLHSTSLPLLMQLLECYFRIYLKYRVTLKLAKCDFLKKRFEFVGHDVLASGNTTAESKYYLINDWKQPTTGDGLHSFFSLCNFYQKFFPLFEAKVSPLRNLYIKYLHKEIPHVEWTPDRTELFNSCKVDLTSSPVLARFDSSKPVFIKTDWSSTGMSFILMQPTDDATSIAATKKLLSTGEFDFDLSMTGPRLQTFMSGMRMCTDVESHYHSFVGEVAAFRWSVSKCRVYLWGTRFYALCDMQTLYKIL